MGEIVVNAAIRGSVLALLAVGITLVFGVGRFANLMQVEFATLGAYGVLLASSVVGAGLLLDTLLGVVVVGLGAVVLSRVVFARLLSRDPTSAMIGSLALSILVRALLQLVAGPNPRALDLPLERGQELLGVLVTPTQIRTVAISVGALVLTMALLRLSPLGRAIRAVAANRELAAAAGVDVRRVTDMVWLVAGLLGALAGALLAIDTQVSLGMGFSLLLPVFAAALLGGFGSPGGAIVAAYGLALVESTALTADVGGVQLPVNWQPAVGFVVLVAVLCLRPQGIFGRSARVA
jgi:branched-subunit amino acid ABC-type transport system permease component